VNATETIEVMLSEESKESSLEGKLCVYEEYYYEGASACASPSLLQCYSVKPHVRSAMNNTGHAVDFYAKYEWGQAFFSLGSGHSSDRLPFDAHSFKVRIETE
jgi:hypothetical protein